MTESTARFALPLLAAGQAQKELFHNEAVAAIDALLMPALSPPQNVPPSAPDDGSGFIVGNSPEDAWSGHADAIALRLGGGWRFVAPRAGTTAQLADGRTAYWDGSAWNLGRTMVNEIVVDGVAVVGAQRPAIADPAGGATVDTESRTALAAVLAALRDHGLIAT